VRARHEEYNSLQHCQEGKLHLFNSSCHFLCHTHYSQDLSFRQDDSSSCQRKSTHIFHLQKDLLALHSGYFKDRLAENEQHEDQEASPPNINASEFAECACWLLGYSFMPVNNVVLHTDTNILDERLWQLGAFLRAPGLQNFAIDDILRYCKDNAKALPICEEVAAI
jgi:hypothetical protein